VRRSVYNSNADRSTNRTTVRQSDQATKPQIDWLTVRPQSRIWGWTTSRGGTHAARPDTATWSVPDPTLL